MFKFIVVNLKFISVFLKIHFCIFKFKYFYKKWNFHIIVFDTKADGFNAITALMTIDKNPHFFIHYFDVGLRLFLQRYDLLVTVEKVNHCGVLLL
jgi:hypothetical protein